MIISLNLTNEEETLIREYTDLRNLNVSDFVYQTIMEKIEDEYDLSTYNKALNEYKKDRATYTLDEVKEELNLK